MLKTVIRRGTKSHPIYVRNLTGSFTYRTLMAALTKQTHRKSSQWHTHTPAWSHELFTRKCVRKRRKNKQKINMNSSLRSVFRTKKGRERALKVTTQTQYCNTRTHARTVQKIKESEKTKKFLKLNNKYTKKHKCMSFISITVPSGQAKPWHTRAACRHVFSQLLEFVKLLIDFTLTRV